MKYNDTSKNYQKGNLKALIHFPEYLDPVIPFYDVNWQEQLNQFLGLEDKERSNDPDKKWI
jgi:hypothetical protein